MGAAVCLAQTAFEVAALKPSAQRVGRDYLGTVVFGPERVSGRNVSLKDMIAAAWQVAPFQITGGPRWLDSDEFDLDARAAGPAGRAALSLMLQTLLTERFHLAVRKESKEVRVYALAVAAGGPKIQPVPADSPRAARGFRGDMQQLAQFLSVQLSIPPVSDPTRPSVATTPVPVVDETGLTGIYEFNPDLQPEAGVDMMVLWQRILRDKLGLELKGRRSPVDFLAVDRADRL